VVPLKARLAKRIPVISRQKLAKTRAISQEEMDDAIQSEMEAKAAVETSKAAIEAAQGNYQLEPKALPTGIRWPQLVLIIPGFAKVPPGRPIVAAVGLSAVPRPRLFSSSLVGCTADAG
jgi:hypothetical protein